MPKPALPPAPSPRETAGWGQAFFPVRFYFRPTLHTVVTRTMLGVVELAD